MIRDEAIIRSKASDLIQALEKLTAETTRLRSDVLNKIRRGLGAQGSSPKRRLRAPAPRRAITCHMLAT